MFVVIVSAVVVVVFVSGIGVVWIGTQYPRPQQQRLPPHYQSPWYTTTMMMKMTMKRRKREHELMLFQTQT